MSIKRQEKFFLAQDSVLFIWTGISWWAYLTQEKVDMPIWLPILATLAAGFMLGCTAMGSVLIRQAEKLNGK